MVPLPWVQNHPRNHFFCVQTWPNLIQEGNISQVDYNSNPGFVGDPTPLICLLVESLIVIAVVPDVDGRI